ncbi:hypothetical protein D9757_004068 [Collybiopsis confluens]|uniref:Uncharacterized protein n=1 Tax=Collybiopsis confluens TaxID=2823264 RepID=A0A8H5HXE8_9AGAR|nr:hypothetical protein D9757_004068 [Collybiopsis confluens]
MILPRPSPLFFVFFLGLFLLKVRLASARLYPTRPVQGTVYRSQKCDPITWKDDGKSPNMQAMGLMSVDLYLGTKRLFRVDDAYSDAGMLMLCPPGPSDFSWPQNFESDFLCEAEATILSRVVRNADSCFGSTLWFTSEDENTTVYTHDFRILGVSATNETSSDVPQASVTSTSATTSAKAATVTTSASTLSHQRPSGYDTSSTTVYADPLPGSDEDGKVDINRAHHKYHGGAFSWKGMDTERMKFRFVFIVWPAIIGISMAL